MGRKPQPGSAHAQRIAITAAKRQKAGGGQNQINVSFPSAYRQTRQSRMGLGRIQGPLNFRECMKYLRHKARGHPRGGGTIRKALRPKCQHC